MRVGVQFTGSIPGGQTRRWFTFNWPAAWHVIWNVVPTSPRQGSPQVDWDVAVEKAANGAFTYWITITNLTPDAVNIEARYAVMN